MRYIIFLFLIFSSQAFGQWKTYKVGAKGDTLNCVDQQNRKQGKWIIHQESLRGEPGFDQEGEFKDDKKEGVWRTFSLMGDLLAIENYRWGNKNGSCRYFTIAGLVREENWKAVNPENPYDTIDVPDLNDPYKVERKVIKLEGSSVKHGTWNYYDPGSGTVVKTEDYFLDKLEDPHKKLLQAQTNVSADSSATAVEPAANKVVPPEVKAYEKKNSNKKKIRVRDGHTGY